MGLRVRKTIRVLSGLRVNLSRSGISTSIGEPGATVNVGRRGARATVGLPGTGISYSQRLGAAQGSPGAVPRVLIVLAIIVAVIIGLAVGAQA